MSNILITGSTGFIGSNLLNYFSKKEKIYIILRKKNSTKNKNFTNKNITKIIYTNYNDLNRKLQKIKASTVIHCATHYIRKHNHNDIQKLSESNILFGNIILENLTKMKTKKFINFSTVWEDYNAIKDNTANLYSTYKKGFSFFLDYYKKTFPKIKFFNLMIADTFGKNDKRLKIINMLKNNYKNNKVTKIISNNLFINLLNIKDILDAVNLIVKKNISPDKYLLKNKNSFKILDIIDYFNEHNTKNIKVKWLSKKNINEKIYSYKLLSGWSPKHSKIKDIIDIIKV